MEGIERCFRDDSGHIFARRPRSQFDHNLGDPHRGNGIDLFSKRFGRPFQRRDRLDVERRLQGFRVWGTISRHVEPASEPALETLTADRPSLAMAIDFQIDITRAVGRAERDGNPARDLLLQSYIDRRTHEFFHERNYPDERLLDQIP